MNYKKIFVFQKKSFKKMCIIWVRKQNLGQSLPIQKFLFDSGKNN